MIRCAKGRGNLGKWEPAATMCRLVRELEQMLEEAGALEKGDQDAIANIYYEFLETLPKKVQEDLHHG